jgi:hypothetical protein
MENNLGEIITALIMLIIRHFEKRQLKKKLTIEKEKAVESTKEIFNKKLDDLINKKNGKHEF